jgi:asparagine synthase (glutamine-hydrolysing)
MCGIYGTNKGYSYKIIKEKLEAINFRGPDFSKFVTYDDVTFGHNRLSIIDLDERSSQPFEYQDIVLVFNGEIYNFETIKDELTHKGYSFKTLSDTEVICAAYLEWGEKCVDKLNGMFAFVIYDRQKKILFGARDRFGQKPFYYCLDDGKFEFGSQIKQILVGNKKFELNPLAVEQVLTRKYISEPNTIFKNIFKLKAGNIFTYDLKTSNFSEKPYWDIDKKEDILDISYNDAKVELHSLLKDAVKKRMVSDVPLGVFLSGGIDSSLVASLAQASSSNPIRTFSIRFGEQDFDESIYAGQVADVLSTKHTVIDCSINEGIDLINNMADYYDEPFADNSSIPSLLLAKYTRQHVTVALSGDAGDETFLGYGRYEWATRMEKVFKIPYPLRFFMSSIGKMIPNYKIAAGARGIGMRNIEELYWEKVSLLNKHKILNHKPQTIDNAEYAEYLVHQNKKLIERLSDYELKTYLNDDINTKVDRATMAFSLEARAPLMDYRVVEFAKRLPTSYKNNGVSKRILKDILYEYCPKEIFDRPKSGFAMPIKHWLRGPLKLYTQELLSQDSLSKTPMINSDYVQMLMKEHLSGEEDRSAILWNILMFVSWRDKYQKFIQE